MSEVSKQTVYNLVYLEISRFLKKINIDGIIIGAESVILHTKSRLTTMDIDYLLSPPDFSKLFDELKDKGDLDTSANSYITSIEIEPTGWISFILHLKKPKFEIAFEFINLNNIESPYRKKISHIIKSRVKKTIIHGEEISFLPTEVVFALRLAISDWEAYIHKTNANIAELKVAGYEVNWKDFEGIIKELNLEKRASGIEIDR